MKKHMSDDLAAFEAVDDDKLAGEVRRSLPARWSNVLPSTGRSRGSRSKFQMPHVYVPAPRTSTGIRTMRADSSLHAAHELCVGR
jgi:hypothetical protein